MRRVLTRKVFLLAVVCVLMVVVAACGGNNTNGANDTNGTNGTNGTNDISGTNDGAAGTDTLAAAQEAGVMTVGFANEKPYAYLNEQNELSGEAVDIARAVLGNLDIAELDGKLLDFGQLISGLQTEKYDIITAGMAVMPDRCEKVIFAEPEYRMGGALAVQAGNPKDLHSYADIGANPDAKIAVMTGAIEIEQLKNEGVQDDQIIEVPDQPTAINALQSGQVDGITMTFMALMEMLNSAADENLIRVEDFTQPLDENGEEMWSYGAAAFRQADTELRDAYNAELQKLKDSGELLTHLTNNGFAEEHLPGDMTTQQLCGE